jgi:hypothetical protein
MSPGKDLMLCANILLTMGVVPPGEVISGCRADKRTAVRD